MKSEERKGKQMMKSEERKGKQMMELITSMMN